MIKAVKGTRDILPDEISKWHFLETAVRKIFKNYNYKEIRTPVFEETNLFSRGIGESTDIVGKEMYTFLDRGKTSITLKPEMTASVVRAFIEHSLSKKYPINKLYYISPMFRQEKQQLGRYRQFHQFGAEAIGSADPSLDAEMIILAYDILGELGLKDLEIKINSLGVPAVREDYKILLKDYLRGELDRLSEDSRVRFGSNIMRIFDSKDPADQKIMENAPRLIDHLDTASLEHFDSVQGFLNEAGIPFVIESRLVRGLDYYTHTTFEIISGRVGAQSALCGGGRYDLLVEDLGGQPAPGVGFAAGIERILIACENEGTLKFSEESIDLYIVLVDRGLFKVGYGLAVNLRRKGLAVELDYLSRSVKAQMREANRLSSSFVMFLGGEEFASNRISLKDMSSGDQESYSIEDINTIIKFIKGN